METTEIWWPSLEALNDLAVEDSEEGFTLSAPDGTECADWLAYYNQTDELRDQFNSAFVRALTDHLNQLIDKDGSPIKVAIGDENPSSIKTEENEAGSV